MKKWKSDDKVRICPNCGSLKLKGFHTLSPSEISLYVNTYNKHFEGINSNTDSFLCQDCHSLEICPEIKAEDVEKFRKNLKKTPKQKTQIKPLSKWQKYLSIITLVYFLFFIASIPFLDKFWYIFVGIFVFLVSVVFCSYILYFFIKLIKTKK